MTVAALLQLLNTLLALAQAGTQIFDFLSQIKTRVEAAQASGKDLTADDWAFIDQLAASNLAVAKGYLTLTEALAATPVAPAPVPAPESAAS